MTERVIIGDAVLYHGDAYEIVPTLTGIDACVSDPPYGISFQKGVGGKGLNQGRRHTDPIHGDDKPFDPSLFLTRDSEDAPLRVKWPCVLFGGNHFSTRLPDGGTFHAWDKLGGMESFGDSFSDVEFAWISWRCASRIKRYLWKGVLQDGEKGKPKYHVSQKPIEVMAWCLDMVPDAKTILDPFMGSGSTGVACAKRGRRFIGIEYERKHFDVACKRIDEAQQQPDLVNLMLAPRVPVQEGLPL